MDLWEILNDDRNRLLAVKDVELKNFNERIERMKLNLHQGVNIQDWTEKEFYSFSNELKKVLQSLTSFLVDIKVDTEYMGRISKYGSHEYKFCECKIYFNDEFLTSFGIRF